MAGGTLLKVTLYQNFGGMHTIGNIRLAATNSPRPVKPVSYTHLTLPTNREE